MQEVHIYTDGACFDNGLPTAVGGYGCVLTYTGYYSRVHSKEISGRVLSTPTLYVTNQRVEIIAAIKAISILRRPCNVILYSDSQYLVMSCSKNNRWKRKSNQDLWAELDIVSAPHEIDYMWVRGHNGNQLNERCDQLAYNAAKGT
jgi:ribonuclease HI